MLKQFVKKTLVFRYIRLFTRGNILILVRRLKNKFNLAFYPEFKELHNKLHTHLKNQLLYWPHLKYEMGYFYQGYDRIKISGSRPSEKRFKQYRLAEHLKPDMRVLDIGANSCFLSIMIAEYVSHVDAVEINPYLTAIGKDVADWLKIKNISFINADFLSVKLGYQYDLIMSFANHYTDDENMRPNLRSYFERLHSCLSYNGKLLFESHSNDVDSEDFERVISSLKDLYDLDWKDFFSNGVSEGDRLFYCFTKKNKIMQ